MLSEALRLLRVYNDIKQKALAEKLGLSNSHISEIENGNKTPSMEVIQKYSEFFKIPASSIMFFSEQITDDPSQAKIIKFLKVIEGRTEIID